MDVTLIISSVQNILCSLRSGRRTTSTRWGQWRKSLWSAWLSQRWWTATWETKLWQKRTKVRQQCFTLSHVIIHKRPIGYFSSERSLWDQAKPRSPHTDLTNPKTSHAVLARASWSKAPGALTCFPRLPVTAALTPENGVWQLHSFTPKALMQAKRCLSHWLCCQFIHVVICPLHHHLHKYWASLPKCFNINNRKTPNRPHRQVVIQLWGVICLLYVVICKYMKVTVSKM